MGNKRLLVCLLTLVFVGGLGVASTFIFRVQEVNVSFDDKNPIMLSADVKATEIKDKISGDVKDKNILFGLDRDKVKDKIHKAEPLVRVKKIEAKFPNKLQVVIEERFPIYYIDYGDNQTAVMDYELQMISNNKEAMEVLFGVTLVEIKATDLRLKSNQSEFEVGDNLRDYIYDEPSMKKADTLELMVRYFLGKEAKYEESGICHLIESVDFDASAHEAPAGTMTIVLTDPLDLHTSVTFQVRNFQNKFGKKLQKCWQAFNDNPHKSDEGYYFIEDDIKVVWNGVE